MAQHGRRQVLKRVGVSCVKAIGQQCRASKPGGAGERDQGKCAGSDASCLSSTTLSQFHTETWLEVYISVPCVVGVNLLYSSSGYRLLVVISSTLTAGVRDGIVLVR
jgi:hypothetical protein